MKIWRDRRGSNLILVIVLMLLLGILGVGYAAVTSFNVKSSVSQRQYLQGYYLAKSVEQSLVRSITDTGNPAVEALVAKAQQDYGAYQRYCVRWNLATPAEQMHMKTPEEYKKEQIQVPYVSNGKTALDGGGEVKNRLEYYFEEKYLIASTDLTYEGETYQIQAQLKPGFGGSGGDPVPGSAAYALGIAAGGTINMELNMVDLLGKPKPVYTVGNVNGVGVKKNYVGDLVSQEFVFLDDEMTVNGGIWSASGVLLQEVDVTGSIYSLDSLALGGKEGAKKGGNIGGGLFAKGSVALFLGYHVAGDVYSDQLVVLKQGGNVIEGDIKSKGQVISSGGSNVVNGIIYADGDISLNNVTCAGIVCRGNVTLNQTMIYGDVVAGGNVTLSGCMMSGGVVAGGSVTTNPGANTIGADAYGNSIVAGGDIALTKALLSGTAFSGKNIVILDSSTSVMPSSVTGKEGLRAVGNVTYPAKVNAGSQYGKILCNGTINGSPSGITGITPPQKIVVAPVDTTADYTPLAEVVPTLPLDYEMVATKMGNLSKQDLKGHVVLDATAGDVYYVIDPGNNGRVTLDGNNLEIRGDHRVFLVVEDGHQLQLINTIGNKDTSSRLFLVSNNISKKAPSVEMINGSVFYGQIYMPGASFDAGNWGYESHVYGVVTVGTILGDPWDTLNIIAIQGDYSGTNLAEIFGAAGGDSGGGGETGGTGWKVVKYYE